MGLFDRFKNQPPPSSETSSAPNNGKKVLIVEDEKLLGDALEIKFKHAGFATLRAFNGKEGLEVCQKEHPHVIILDLMMPVMDGNTMLRLLRENKEFVTLPVIVLTNAGDLENIRQTQMYYGATDFLIKSNTNTDDLVDRVKKLLF